LLHRETLLVVPSRDAENVPSEVISEAGTDNFFSNPLLLERLSESQSNIMKDAQKRNTFEENEERTNSLCSSVTSISFCCPVAGYEILNCKSRAKQTRWIEKDETMRITEEKSTN
jgi:hypothetical protein